MKIIRLVVGMLAANSYVFYDEDTLEACVVDPGAEVDQILKAVNEHGLTVKEILLTHGHFDHIGAAQALREATKASIAIHKHDQEMLMDPQKNESATGNRHAISFEADKLLDGSSVIKIGAYSISVIPTPGHTKGGVCYQVGDVIFTGDTLFYMGIGRTDLFGGDMEAMLKSLQKLSKLDEELYVLPGHGQGGKLSEIKPRNPYMK